jgi:hypothetical protein
MIHGSFPRHPRVIPSKQLIHLPSDDFTFQMLSSLYLQQSYSLFEDGFPNPRARIVNRHSHKMVLLDVVTMNPSNPKAISLVINVP